MTDKYTLRIQNLILFIIQQAEHGEEWREIPKYDGAYFISNFGRVLSLHNDTAHLLKPIENKDGYYQVSLYRDGKHRTRLIHQLVAHAFLTQEKPNQNEVHHRDRQRHNNRADNLIFVSRAEHIMLHNQKEKEK